MEVPIERTWVLRSGLFSVEVGDEVSFPAEDVNACRLRGVRFEHAVHAPCLDDAGAIGEDLYSCSDLLGLSDPCQLTRWRRSYTSAISEALSKTCTS